MTTMFKRKQRRSPSLIDRAIRAINDWRKKREAYKRFLSLNCTREQARDLAERVL